MSLLAVGSVALDTIKTPRGKVSDVLGGSAVHFSVAASIFTRVRLVAVIGTDFPESHIEFLGGRDIDLEGLETAKGETFRWTGKYKEDMNQRETIAVHLNVFEDFAPKIPEAYRDSRFIFLGNGSPGTQASVLEGVASPTFVLVDTMDLWIHTERDALNDLLRRVDGITLNDEEIRMLTGETNLLAAGRALLEAGPSVVILKKGEHGAMLISRDGTFLLPAFPTEEVRDPTGAGDAFAGGLMGYLASKGEVTLDALRQAIRYGTVAASFNVEDFGTDRIKDVGRADIEERLKTFLGHLGQ